MKVAKGAVWNSGTSWWGRTINLDSNDVKPRTRCVGPTKQEVCTDQIPVAHEFGHSIANVDAYDRGDEYERGSRHESDTRSIMNRGIELRSRHFDGLLSELSVMIADTSFAVDRLQ